MSTLPKNFYRYKQMPIWNNETIAKGILGIHNTKAWVYGKINLIKWELEYFLYDENDEVYETSILSAGNPWIALPQQNHSVKPKWEMEMYIDFYKQKPQNLWEKEEDFIQKYDKFPHFEVIQLLDTLWDLNWKIVADVGCGGGRNGLFLAENGAKKVVFFDKNIEALTNIQSIWQVNNLDLEIKQADFHISHIHWNYDIVISTVALQFLQKQTALRILQEMQNTTNIWGYNLIIVPIQSEDVLCPIDFPFLPKQNEIKNLYVNWEIIAYNEMIWEFHRKDENGVKIKSRFACIVAQKK